MTKVAKVLVVFTTVMSLAFLAFIGVTAVAGPNWQGTAAELDGYTIERVPGDVVSYKVTERVAGKDLGAKPNLPAAIVAAQTDRIQAQTARKTDLDAQIAAVRQARDEEKPASEQDAAGVQLRLGQLAEALDQLDQQVLALTQEGTKQAQEAEKVRSEAAARRADVARLQNELAAVRADRYRVEEQIAQLKQRLIRIGGQIDRAERRREQLQDAPAYSGS
jgi:hypothetical protein